MTQDDIDFSNNDDLITPPTGWDYTDAKGSIGLSIDNPSIYHDNEREETIMCSGGVPRSATSTDSDICSSSATTVRGLVSFISQEERGSGKSISGIKLLPKNTGIVDGYGTVQVAALSVANTDVSDADVILPIAAASIIGPLEGIASSERNSQLQTKSSLPLFHERSSKSVGSGVHARADSLTELLDSAEPSEAAEGPQIQTQASIENSIVEIAANTASNLIGLVEDFSGLHIFDNFQNVLRRRRPTTGNVERGGGGTNAGSSSEENFSRNLNERLLTRSANSLSSIQSSFATMPDRLYRSSSIEKPADSNKDKVPPQHRSISKSPVRRSDAGTGLTAGESPQKSRDKEKKVKNKFMVRVGSEAVNFTSLLEKFN